MKRMLDLDPGLSSSISDHQRIIAFRNKLIHGYSDIAHDVVWGVMESNLPKLGQEVKELLASGGGEL